MTNNQVGSTMLVKFSRVSGRRPRTVAVPERRPRVVQVVIQLVVDETKGENQEVKEDPDEEKQATATLIDHPDLPLLEESHRFVRSLRGGGGRVRALEGLQPPPLGLVSLEVTGLGCPVGIRLLEIGVLVQI